MNDLYDKFLKDIKVKMVICNLTQSQLADNIGVNKVTLSRFFNRQSVSMKLVDKILSYLDRKENKSEYYMMELED